MIFNQSSYFICIKTLIEFLDPSSKLSLSMVYPCGCKYYSITRRISSAQESNIECCSNHLRLLKVLTACYGKTETTSFTPNSFCIGDTNAVDVYDENGVKGVYLISKTEVPVIRKVAQKIDTSEKSISTEAKFASKGYSDEHW